MNIRTIALIVGALGVIAIIGIALFIQQQVQEVVRNQTIAQSKVVTGPINATVSLASHGIMNYNFSNQFVGYAVINYGAKNASSMNISIGMYRKNPIARVYLINTINYCLQVECFPIGDLYGKLRNDLGGYGRVLNTSSVVMININNITKIPNNSVIVLSSGLMPNILLPDINSTNGCIRYNNYSILTLLNKGDSIVYVGKNFSTSATCNQQEVYSSPMTTQALVSAGINATPVSNLKASIVSITANSPLTFNSPTFILQGGNNYYGVWSANVTNGTIVTMSNNITAGWNHNTTKLAQDIATVIESKFWLGRVAYGNIVQNGGVYGGTVTAITNITIPSNYQNATTTDLINSSYSLVTLVFRNLNYRYEVNIPFSTKFINNGFVYMSPELGQTEAGTINAEINNLTDNNAAIAVINIYDAGLTRIVTSPYDLGSIRNGIEVPKHPSFTMAPGYYVASLEANGNVYSRALFRLDGFQVSPLSIDFRNGTFLFSVFSHNRSIGGLPYQVSLNGAYNSSQGVISDTGIINYTLPKGIPVSYGNEQFSFMVAGQSYNVTYKYVNTSQGINPLYIELAIAIIVVAILNKILVPTQIDEYYIDLPVFPPSKRQRVKESTEAILNVFELVNYYYHWKYMPLTIPEIKTGVGTNIKYGSTSIAVTSQNTLAMLNKLIEKGMVESADDYFAPKKWLEQSKHDIEYLVIYRKLRDYCVGNALLFTDLDAAQGTDMIVTAKTMQNYIFIYSSQAPLKELTISSKSKIYLVFLNEEIMQEFIDKLYLSYSEQAEVLKMGIDYGYIRLTHTGNLSILKL